MSCSLGRAFGSEPTVSLMLSSWRTYNRRAGAANMIILTFSLILAFCSYVAYRLSNRTRRGHWGWSQVWRLACVIAGLRVTALWLGAAGLRRPDWLQGPGYVVWMLDLPELYLVRDARTYAHLWEFLGSLILVATSFAWAAAFVWLRNRVVKHS